MERGGMWYCPTGAVRIRGALLKFTRILNLWTWKNCWDMTSRSLQCAFNNHNNNHHKIIHEAHSFSDENHTIAWACTWQNPAPHTQHHMRQEKQHWRERAICLDTVKHIQFLHTHTTQTCLNTNTFTLLSKWRHPSNYQELFFFKEISTFILQGCIKSQFPQKSLNVSNIDNSKKCFLSSKSA